MFYPLVLVYQQNRSYWDREKDRERESKEQRVLKMQWPLFNVAGILTSIHTRINNMYWYIYIYPVSKLMPPPENHNWICNKTWQRKSNCESGICWDNSIFLFFGWHSSRFYSFFSSFCHTHKSTKFKNG